jgi:conjugal transfer pilin signal peptidase TrbI
MSNNWFLNYKNSYKKAIWVFVLTFVGFGVVTDNCAIVLNNSNSCAVKCFLQVSKISPQKGDFTLVDHANGKRLIKKIIGRSGDKISYDANQNLLVGNFKVGKILDKDSKNQPLHSISACNIPQNYVFLYAPHPQSFDSRYQEVGLIHQDNLKGKLIAIF